MNIKTQNLPLNKHEQIAPTTYHYKNVQSEQAKMAIKKQLKQKYSAIQFQLR